MLPDIWDQERVRRWRRRAEEYRTLAEKTSDEEIRLSMLAVVESYEMLATQGETSITPTLTVVPPDDGSAQETETPEPSNAAADEVES